MIEHDHWNRLGSLEPVVVRHDVTRWLPDREAAPARASAFDAIITMGGVANPHDDEGAPWIPGEVDLLVEALADDVPVLGVCLGGQLLARAAGGWVGRGTAEFGWGDPGLTPAAAADPVFGGLTPDYRAYQAHFCAFDAPPRATILAANPAAVQVARVGARAWACQFHLEVTPAISDSWLTVAAQDYRDVGWDIDELRAETARRADAYAGDARDIARRFLAVAAE